MKQSSSDRTLRQAINSSLCDAGFQRRGDHWYRAVPPTIQVANLQKSRFGGRFYLNICLGIPELSGIALPKEYQCELRIRASALRPDNPTEIANLLDADSTEIPEAARRLKLELFVREAVLPFFDRVGDIARLRSALEDGALAQALVTQPLRVFLESTDPVSREQP